jgi:hypothetical protein
MPEAQVGLHPVLSGNVTLDPSVPSILVSLVMACWEDTESRRPETHDTPVSDQCPIPALC